MSDDGSANAADKPGEPDAQANSALAPAKVVQKRSPLPDLGDFLFLIVLLFQINLLPNYLFGDGSTGWHLAIGKYVLQHGSVPYNDFISYTFAGKPWIAFYWFPDVLMALAAQIAGYNGVALLVATTISTLFLLLYLRSRKEGCNFLLSGFLVLVGAIASSVHWLARPHIMTFVGTYVIASALESNHRQQVGRLRFLITATVMMLVWVNSHPGFVVGLAMMGIYLAVAVGTWLLTGDSLIKQRARGEIANIAMAIFGAILMTFINPYGLALHRNLGEYLGQSKVVDYVDEYMSPVFHGSIQTGSLELLFLLLVFGLAITRTRPSLPQTLLVMAFMHLTLNAVRNIPLFVLVSVPYIAGLYSKTALSEYFGGLSAVSGMRANVIAKWTSMRQDVDATESQCTMHLLPILTVLFFGIAAVSGGNLAGQEIMNSKFDPRQMPTATLDCIKKQGLDPKHGFNHVNWGGYINYVGGIPVFIDDRSSFYGEPFYLSYGRIVSLYPDWEKLLEEHKIDWVIFPKRAELSERLKQHPGWKTLCEDGAAYVFVRR